MPVAIGLSVELVLVLALVVSFGFLMLYRGTLKPLLLGLSLLFYFRIGAGPVSLGRPLGAIGDALRKLADTIDNGIAQAVLASEHGVIVVWHALAQQARWLGQVLAELAETVEAKFRWLLWAFPPAAALWLAVRAAQKLPELVKALTHGTTHTVTTVKTRAEVLDRQAVGRISALEGELAALTDQVAAVAAGGVAIPLPRIGNPAEDLAALRAKLRGLSKWLTAAGAAALVGAALVRLGLRWLRCPNVGKVGRQVCRVNSSVLDSLLLGTTVIASTISVVELAEYLLSIQSEVLRGVQAGFRELKGVQPIDFDGYLGPLSDGTG